MTEEMTEGLTEELRENLPGEEQYPREFTERFELLEQLSEAEDSETLLVKERGSSRLCVAKCYRPESPRYDRTEPEGLKKIMEQQLPAFVGEYRSDAMRCILREYIPGDNLADASRKHAFSDDEVIGIGVQLCDQLSVLHNQDPPVIHRDIKPRNVILGPDGKVTLIDFGIARQDAVHDGEGGGDGKAQDTVVLGTQGFAPPEQYGFRQTDGRSDLYSLGVLLRRLRESAQGKDAGKGAGKGAGNGNAALTGVLERCTAFDPERRYQSAEQLKAALKSASAPARKKRRRALAGLIGAAAVLCAVFVLYMLTAGGRVRFKEPLIAEAARKNLGLSENAALKKSMLGEVKGIYIVADRTLANADEFYPAVNELYADAGGDIGKIAHGSVASLEDLAMMPNLEQVCIAAEELKDVRVLGDLKELNKVEIKHNYVEEIATLAKLGKLTSVGINDNPVQDISPLRDCLNLAFLDLCNVRSYDPSVIAKFGNFNYLDLSNPTDSYNYLAEKSILSLRLAWTSLSSLDPLRFVTNLEDLDISHTDVTDLSGLIWHTGLKRLNLAGLPVSDLSVLKELPLLEEVVLSSEMEPLAEALGEVNFTVRYE